VEYHVSTSPYIPLGSGEPRSKGLHLTDVIRSIQEELGWAYKGKGFQDRDLTMDLGFVWEETLSRAWADRHPVVIRPGEVEKDGIIGSPDGLGPNPGLLNEEGNIIIKPSKKIIAHEYKLTWKSANKRIVDDWYYMTQGKSYCYMMGVDTCLWHVGYLMGDYKGSGPLYRQCYVRFEEQELWANWEMIINHAKEKEMLK